MQVLFACLHADNTFLLCLPSHLIPRTHRVQRKGTVSDIDGQLHLDTMGVHHGSNLHKDKRSEKQIGLYYNSRHDISAAVQSQTDDTKMAVMQATMLSAYQAHQASQHPSKISVLSLLGSDYELPCVEAPYHDTTYINSLRRGCRAVLIAMQKTLYMENRDICGPTIHCNPATLPQDLDVRLCHIQHP